MRYVLDGEAHAGQLSPRDGHGVVRGIIRVVATLFAERQGRRRARGEPAEQAR